MIITIKGQRTEKGCTLTVNGKKLVHKVRYSPTGIEWGYLGSGPADAARSILYTIRMFPGISMSAEFIENCFQKFKENFVAKWQDDEVSVKIDLQEWIKREERKYLEGRTKKRGGNVE